jgi:predicted lipoprotein with Yx(FWY)xxD motif
MSKDTVQLHKTSLGNVLANADGRTLYAFMQDVGGKSACAGSCAQVWPPLTSSAAPTAGAGLDATKLALIARDGGMQQVTYGGIPLYVYSKDTSADDSYGQGIGGVWFVVGADGKPITAPAAATTTTAQRTSSY